MFETAQLLGEKLFVLCKYHSNLSAFEDIPVVLGVIADILSVSKQNTFIRGAILEHCLPATMKLMNLIMNKKIKSRQYYIFISHRLLQVFGLLIGSEMTTFDH